MRARQAGGCLVTGVCSLEAVCRWSPGVYRRRILCLFVCSGPQQTRCLARMACAQDANFNDGLFSRTRLQVLIIGENMTHHDWGSKDHPLGNSCFTYERKEVVNEKFIMDLQRTFAVASSEQEDYILSKCYQYGRQK